MQIDGLVREGQRSFSGIPHVLNHQWVRAGGVVCVR